MKKETGAKIETSVCVCGGAPAVTSTCGNRLMRAEPEAVHADMETHVQTRRQRPKYPETHAPGDTGRDRDTGSAKTRK